MLELNLARAYFDFYNTYSILISRCAFLIYWVLGTEELFGLKLLILGLIE
jgi:hypothetical protein